MLVPKKNSVVIFTCVALFILACIYLYGKYAADDTNEYIGQNEANFRDIDIVDYHFVATNFAFTGQFPVTGYILPQEEYKIASHKELDITYLDMFKKNGPVTSFMRPPLYPLLIGSMYKIFGFKYYYNLRLNILLLSLIIGLMPLVGFSNWGLRGYYSGVIGALIFLKSTHDNWGLNVMDVYVLTTFLFFVVFALGLYAERKDSPRYYIIWGISIGLCVLTKPPILGLLPLIYAVFIFIKYKKASLLLAVKKLAAISIGMALVISPWTIYINHIQKVTVPQRKIWCEKVSAGMEKLEITDMKNINKVDSISDADPCTDPNCKEYAAFLSNIVKSIWLYHSRTTGFMFITNGIGDIFLHLNNEYCADGAMHQEWMFIKSSFYRSHCNADQSTLTKVLLFYYYHPSFLYRIPLGRAIGFFGVDYSLYFLLAASLWGLCVIQLRLFQVERRAKKALLTLFVLLLTMTGYTCCFILSKYTAILLFMPLFSVGVLLYKGDYKSIIPSTFSIMWLSLFIIIFLILSFGKYMMIAMPVSCLCLGYYSLVLIDGFRALAFGSEGYL